MPQVALVTLKLRNHQRQACNFGREVAQLDAAKVGQRELALAARLAPALVDGVLDLAQLLVGNDQKVARAAGRVEHTNAGNALAQVEQGARVVASVLQPGAQIVQKQRVQHFQDVGHAGVVHAQLPALAVIGNGLHHGAEDVGIDARPVQAADVQQIGARDARKARCIERAREQAAVDVGKRIGPGAQARGSALIQGRVHGAKDFAHDLVGVAGVARAHVLDRAGEQALAHEDASVFGKKAKDEPGHEVVDLMAALGRAPVGVVLEQLDVQPVQPAGGADVEAAFADLVDGGDAGQRQKKAEVVGQVGQGAGNGLAAGQLLGLQRVTVGGQDELGLGAGGGGAGAQGGQQGRDLARRGHGDMDVVALEHASGHVGPIGVTLAQALERGVLVAKGGQKGVSELGAVKGLLGQERDGLFDFYGVHGAR